LQTLSLHRLSTLSLSRVESIALLSSEELVGMIELLEVTSLWKAFTTNANNLESTTVTKLLHHERSIEEMGSFLCVGFEALDVVRVSGAESRHELIEL
jgi:hypothetical protein